jgi:F420-dependent oxidoreductase-like protein
MRFALMIEPQQGLTYDEQLAIARTAESAGFESLFRSDHYTSFPGESGLPTTDAWAVIAGLVRGTERITFGTLVSPVTFRLPGNLVKVVTTIDAMSGGRIELGLGAGWNQLEHEQYGLPFPSLRERFDMLEEALAIVHGLWSEPDGWSFEGKYWQVKGAQLRPRPVDRPGRRHPNLIVGGEGGPRSLALAARYADEYNVVSADPKKAREVYARLDKAAAAADRDPATITRSAMTGVLIAESEERLRERVRDQIRMFGEDREDAEAWLASRRARWIMGGADDARARIRDLEAAGVERLMLQDFLPRDLGMIEELGRLVRELG